MMRRRRFMKLIAASAAAVVAQPLSQSFAAPPKEQPSASEARAPSSAVRREIANQKKSLADTLKVIRTYPLEPGSGLAYVFRAAKRRSSRGR